MRILIFWAVMALAVMYTPANASVPVPGPTPPKKIDEKSVGPQTIAIVCPDSVSVNTVNIPAGWQVQEALRRQNVNISLNLKQRQIVCWYGAAGVENAFQTYPIVKQFPDGYQCTIPKPFLYAADCRKPRPILTRESKKN